MSFHWQRSAQGPVDLQVELCVCPQLLGEFQVYLEICGDILDVLESYWLFFFLRAAENMYLV